MSNFLKELIHNRYFSLRDVTMFHLLPDVPYLGGVYEISYSGFGKLCGVDADTAKSFFGKLEAAGLVNVLRNGSRGKNSSFAFTRKESTLHKNNYFSDAPVSPSSGVVRSVRDQNTYYIRTSTDNGIPKNFFRPSPSEPILSQLLTLISDPAYKSESVFALLTDYIHTSAKVQRRNRLSRVG